MKSLLLLSCYFVQHLAFSQQTATGVILDLDDNITLAGVTIVVNGADQIGTISTHDGTFSLEHTNNASPLIFSYTGYRAQEIPIEECKIATVYLSVSPTLLNEVVVVGYRTQVRSDVTGTISTIKKEDIEGSSVNSIDPLLQGRAAGVFVNNESVKLGFSIDVRKKGTASLDTNFHPVCVNDRRVINTIEQLPFSNPRLNPMADINYYDIESIYILKDAPAPAIYKSRASNGVIIITTKKGQASTTHLDIHDYTALTPDENILFFTKKNYRNNLLTSRSFKFNSKFYSFEFNYFT